MKREIKFRAWDSKNKYMLDASFGNWVSFDGVLYEESNLKYNTPNIEISKSKDLILMQFTGLTDKNGVEIYEGDIVAVPYVTPMGQITDDEDTSYRTSIGFNNGAFVLLYPKTDNVPLIKFCNSRQGEYVSNYGNKAILENSTIVTIIGNVFNHPHLLTPTP